MQHGADHRSSDPGRIVNAGRANPHERHASAVKRIVDESIPLLTVKALVASIIELDTENDPKGFRRDEHEVEVLLRDGAPIPGSPLLPRAGDHIRKSHLERDQVPLAHGRPQRMEEPPLGLRHEVTPGRVGQGRAVDSWASSHPPDLPAFPSQLNTTFDSMKDSRHNIVSEVG